MFQKRKNRNFRNYSKRLEIFTRCWVKSTHTNKKIGTDNSIKKDTGYILIYFINKTVNDTFENIDMLVARESKRSEHFTQSSKVDPHSTSILGSKKSFRN